MPIDILTGSAAARAWVDGDADAATLDGLADAPQGWWPATAPHLLYERT